MGKGPLFSMPSFTPKVVLVQGWGASGGGTGRLCAQQGSNCNGGKVEVRVRSALMLASVAGQDACTYVCWQDKARSIMYAHISKALLGLGDDCGLRESCRVGREPTGCCVSVMASLLELPASQLWSSSTGTMMWTHM